MFLPVLLEVGVTTRQLSVGAEEYFLHLFAEVEESILPLFAVVEESILPLFTVVGECILPHFAVVEETLLQDIVEVFSVGQRVELIEGELYR